MAGTPTWLPCTHSPCAGLPHCDLCALPAPRCAHRCLSAQNTSCGDHLLQVPGGGTSIEVAAAPPESGRWPHQLLASLLARPAGLLQSNKGRGNEGMAEMRQAYEFTLDHIGQDFRAGDLWREYIAFVAGPGPGTPAYQALWGDAARPGQEASERLRVLRWAACLAACCVKGVRWEAGMQMGLLWRQAGESGEPTDLSVGGQQGLQSVGGICAGRSA